ncbi:MAG: hypothetical protein ACLFN8_02760 [Candidatus Woesearchaeota archaeon]
MSKPKNIISPNQMSLFDNVTLDNLIVYPLIESDDYKYDFRATFKPNGFDNHNLSAQLLKGFVDDFNSVNERQLNKNMVLPALKSLSEYVHKESVDDVNFGDLALMYLSVKKVFPDDLLLNYKNNNLSKFRKHNGLTRYGLSQHELLMTYANSHFKVL